MEKEKIDLFIKSVSAFNAYRKDDIFRFAYKVNDWRLVVRPADGVCIYYGEFIASFVSRHGLEMQIGVDDIGPYVMMY